MCVARAVQLLHKLKVRSADGSATLLKVIKNPISRHLPAGFKCYGTVVRDIAKILRKRFRRVDRACRRSGYGRQVLDAPAIPSE